MSTTTILLKYTLKVSDNSITEAQIMKAIKASLKENPMDDLELEILDDDQEVIYQDYLIYRGVKKIKTEGKCIEQN
jgi:hypothetical protein